MIIFFGNPCTTLPLSSSANLVLPSSTTTRRDKLAPCFFAGDDERIVYDLLKRVLAKDHVPMTETEQKRGDLYVTQPGIWQWYEEMLVQERQDLAKKAEQGLSLIHI